MKSATQTELSRTNGSPLLGSIENLVDIPADVPLPFPAGRNDIIPPIQYFALFRYSDHIFLQGILFACFHNRHNTISAIQKHAGKIRFTIYPLSKSSNKAQSFSHSS